MKEKGFFKKYGIAIVGVVALLGIAGVAIAQSRRKTGSLGLTTLEGGEVSLKDFQANYDPRSGYKWGVFKPLPEAFIGDAARASGATSEVYAAMKPWTGMNYKWRDALIHGLYIPEDSDLQGAKVEHVLAWMEEIRKNELGGRKIPGTENGMKDLVKEAVFFRVQQLKKA